MMNYTAIFENAVDSLRSEKRYRVFADIERIAVAAARNPPGRARVG